MLKFWINNRRIVITVSSLILLVMTVPALYYSIILLITAYEIWSAPSSFLAIKISKYEFFLIISELILLLLSMVGYAAIFILRNVSKKFRQNYFAITFIALVSSILFFVSSVTLLNVEYLPFAQVLNKLPKIIPLNLKELYQDIRLLKFGYIVKLIISCFVGLSFPIFALGLVSETTLDDWTKSEERRRIIRKVNQKYKKNKK